MKSYQYYYTIYTLKSLSRAFRLKPTLYCFNHGLKAVAIGMALMCKWYYLDIPLNPLRPGTRTAHKGEWFGMLTISIASVQMPFCNVVF